MTGVFWLAIAQAWQNIRANLLHTLLSVLGIVIGVAALVGILSLIDGMERYAQEQISSTTNLQTIQIQPLTTTELNGVAVPKTTVQPMDGESFAALRALLQPQLASARAQARFNLSIKVADAGPQLGVQVEVHAGDFSRPPTWLMGQWQELPPAADGTTAIAINETLARLLVDKQPLERAKDRLLLADGQSLRVASLRQNQTPNDPPTILIPLLGTPMRWLSANPPRTTLVLDRVEAIPSTTKKLEAWLKKRFAAGAQDFAVRTNSFRVEQVAQGFLVFRLVMGFIVGISVLVGGIGVMNVLLISVTERTAEIGLRKALGAKRQDIVRLFLAESLTIAGFGCTLGLLLGVAATLVFVPVIKWVTQVPFQAAYTANTLLVIAGVTLLIGIVFGVYPALKAARLDPVEALRRE